MDFAGGLRGIGGRSIRRDIEEDRLALLLPAYVTPEIPISVVYASRRRLAPKVRLFIEPLAARL